MLLPEILPEPLVSVLFGAPRSEAEAVLGNVVLGKVHHWDKVTYTALLALEADELSVKDFLIDSAEKVGANSTGVAEQLAQIPKLNSWHSIVTYDVSADDYREFHQNPQWQHTVITSVLDLLAKSCIDDLIRPM